MSGKIKGQIFFLGGILALMLVFSPCLWGEGIGKGSVLGFVYEKDVTTPVKGAVVKLKNVTSGEVYESTPSDSRGNFLIEQMESGVYVYGVTSSEGDFNADGMIGVRIEEGKPARMSLTLSRYQEEQESKAAAADNTSDEYLVGEVVKYIPGTKMAHVRIIRGVLESGDRIHVLGDRTDFFQKAGSLNLNGSKVKRLFVNQIGLFKAKKDSKEGDLVYLAKEGGLGAFLWSPCGIAALAISTATIGYITYNQVTDGDPASPFK